MSDNYRCNIITLLHYLTMGELQSFIYYFFSKEHYFVDDKHVSFECASNPYRNTAVSFYGKLKIPDYFKRNKIKLSIVF